jgi:hypothetical protein
MKRDAVFDQVASGLFRVPLEFHHLNVAWRMALGKTRAEGCSRMEVEGCMAKQLLVINRVGAS